MFDFIEVLDSVVVPLEIAQGARAPSVLVITKAGKYVRGHITDHNVRINSDSRLRGRIVILVDGQKKEIDANDIQSLEKT